MASYEPMEKQYDPRSVEGPIYEQWLKSGAFTATPDGRPHAEAFTMVIPPPNVTGALHLGHALNNTLQDILVRYHRMRGFNTLWQPGTDHAGIATQAVVEKRIRETEGLTRHEVGRERLVERIWEWKDEYEKRIISQLQLMGCSCDWDRTRFTLDKGLAAAVRTQFFNMFKAGLIFRGKRLVNWDTELQTAVANDEVYYETVKGKFWHFKYPVIDPKPGEPEFVIIATTRPETMLGDTAVAVCPDPVAAFDKHEAKLRDDLENAADKDKPAIEKKLEAATERRDTHLEHLLQLAAMAKENRKLRLPLVEREIPLIADPWANPLVGTGCVKITPAHDPNDYVVGQRHDLPMINVMTVDGMIAPITEPDGSRNEDATKRYAGLVFAGTGREKVVEDMDARGLLADVVDHEHEQGHSDRSKAAIEPFLSDQWFVQTEDVNEETAQRRGDSTAPDTTPNVNLPGGSSITGLAQGAMDAVNDGDVKIFPSRYGKSYLDWLGEKRDWCISRQLWWGHRNPVWVHRGAATGPALTELAGRWHELPISRAAGEGEPDLFSFRCCATEPTAEDKTLMRENSWEQEEDVLDTWFSSALWPFSTLGWPGKMPENIADVEQYYPGSVLCTSRDIITNWVARMVMFGLFSTGKVPFDHVYIHPKILDGRGETMSKSKGNGVDPVDVIHTHSADALRYTMADLCTETQDIRMPVEYTCPHCGKLTDQTQAIKTEEQSRKSRGGKLTRKLQPADCHRVTCINKSCGKEFATRWSEPALQKELGLARETSDKFDIGRNFCTKLWNAARYAMMNLEGVECREWDIAALPPEDRWILARLSQTIRRYHECLKHYQFAASVRELREFFWDSLCDWYIELTKPRLTADSEEATRPGADPAKQVLAFCLDQVLRLWHPTMPFITERIWAELNQIAPKRGLPKVAEVKTNTLLVVAEFPPVGGHEALADASIVETFAALQTVTRAVRDLRLNCDVPPKQRVNVTVVAPHEELEAFTAQSHIVKHMAGIAELTVLPEADRPKNAASLNVKGLKIYVHDISDDEAERTRTTKTLAELEKKITGTQRKLSNEKFVANAKPEVVEVERTRLAEFETQHASLTVHLAELNA